MTTIYSTTANGQFFVAADTTGDLDLRISNSNVGILMTSNGDVSFSNASITIPTANTNSPEVGMLRFNSSNNKFEGYNGSTWAEFIY
jgi:hypothetical protein